MIQPFRSTISNSAAGASDQAARAALMNAAMRVGFFTPGAVSTPDDTSTAGAPVTQHKAISIAAAMPTPHRALSRES